QFCLREEPTADATQALMASLRKRRLRIFNGGAALHVVKGADKGRAAALVTKLYRRNRPDARVFSVGIGDSENDLPLLARADFKIFVGDPRQLPPMTRARTLIPTARGPEGFREGITMVLDELGL